MNRFDRNYLRAFTIGTLAAPALLVAGVGRCQAQQRLTVAPKTPTVTMTPRAVVTRKHPLDVDLVAKRQPDGLILLRGNIKYSPIVPGATYEFGKYSLYRSTGKDWEPIFSGSFMVDPYERVAVTSRGITPSTRFKMSVVLTINGREHAKEVEAAAP